jgi:hypothetical protein
MVFKNMRAFYKRKCDLCGKDIIAVYSEKTSFPVFCPACWWSDKWSALDYNQEYDFSKPFLKQFQELLNKVPRISLLVDHLRSVNSDYANYSGPLKNCYLVTQAEDDENCSYSSVLTHSQDSMECTNAQHVQKSYELFNCENCYQVLFSVNCTDCINVYLSKNLKNCNNCFGCDNLRNKNYHIFNKPYSKEEYFNLLKHFNIASYKELQKIKEGVYKFWELYPNKYFQGLHNVDVSGDYINDSNNVFNSFEITGGEKMKYCFQAHMPPIKDCYDYGDWGNNASLCYESINCGEGISNVKFSFGSWIGNNWQYCDTAVSCDNLLGCINIRKAKYCILNKQYSKEQYEELVPRIIEHMNKMPYVDNKGRIYKYGEFFPPELSPFCYNETVAQEYFPLTKEQAISQGYRWKDPENRDLQIDIRTEDLPDHIKDVNDDIIGKIIECSHQGKCNEQCTQAFKIIKPELDFYRKMNLPLPRLCPNCRHYQRIKQRNPLKLWHRKCMCNQQPTTNNPQQTTPKYQNTIKHFHGDNPCPNEFETTYSPDRQEIVYCEKCYNTEVA